MAETRAGHVAMLTQRLEDVNDKIVCATNGRVDRTVLLLLEEFRDDLLHERALVLGEQAIDGLLWITNARQQIVDLAVEHGLTFAPIEPLQRTDRWALRRQNIIAVDGETAFDAAKYGRVLHEIGLVIVPIPETDYPSVPVPIWRLLNTSRLAPRAELSAWEWTMSRAVQWTRDMRTAMVDDLYWLKDLFRATGDFHLLDAFMDKAYRS